MDLIEISPNSKPPVCKILDFGKFRYEIENSYIYPSQVEKVKEHLKQYVEKAKNKQIGIYKE